MACGVLETADHFFFGSKKMRRQANRSVSTDRRAHNFGCAGAELLGDFYFEKIKILLPKNASDEKIFLRFEKIFWG